MKIKKLIKALYYANPEQFGFRPGRGFSIDKIWEDVIKPDTPEVGSTDKITLTGNAKWHIDMYIVIVRDDVAEWYRHQENPPENPMK